jgi:hypothetical protein
MANWLCRLVGQPLPSIQQPAPFGDLDPDRPYSRDLLVPTVLLRFMLSFSWVVSCLSRWICIFPDILFYHPRISPLLRSCYLYKISL